MVACVPIFALVYIATSLHVCLYVNYRQIPPTRNHKYATAKWCATIRYISLVCGECCVSGSQLSAETASRGVQLVWLAKSTLMKCFDTKWQQICLVKSSFMKYLVYFQRKIAARRHVVANTSMFISNDFYTH